MHKKKIALMAFLLGLVSGNISQAKEKTVDTVGQKWKEAFLNPPESTKPYVFWYWESNNISKEGITRDLEAMVKVGIGEAFIGNTIGRRAPIGNVNVFSEEWWNCIVHACSEAKRLGMRIGLFNCPGWRQSGGPWVKPDQTMRYLHSQEVRISGGKPFQYTFKPEKKDFQLVAVQAFPVPAKEGELISRKSPKVISKEISNACLLFDGDRTNKVSFIKPSTQITVSLAAPATVRSLQIIPADDPVTAACKLEARDSSGEWQQVADLTIDRAKVDMAIGPILYGTLSVSFPAVTAVDFRITFDKARGSLREIELSGAACLTSYVEKQLGKLWPYPDVLPDTYRWPVTPEPEDKSLTVSSDKVIDLSAQLDGNVLSWNAPEGEWIVLFTGMVPTGARNSPAAPEATGLEIDKMNKELAKFHFDSYIGEVLHRLPADIRPVLRHVIADSYEKGPQNWTDGLGEDFKRIYGYEPYPYFPVLTGRIVGSAERSERFLWDMRRLIADRIASDYMGGLRERCEENGLRLWLENYGHWGYPGEFLNYGGASHVTAGEFHLTKLERGAVEVRCAASAGHIYGKPVISCESFTSGSMFKPMPADLKARGEWSWCEGINHVLMHVYIHQPDERKPGISAWFGTDFNRHNTWFSASKSYFDYIRRSCALLQSGIPVADVIYFIGEDAPAMTGYREPALPRGYDYDFINGEVLRNDTRVVNGRITLSSGVSYAVLVLPPLDTMRPETLSKIASLVKNGACVVGNPPRHSPSGKDYPNCDEQVKKLAEEMWGENTGNLPLERKYGKGRIFSNTSLEEVFTKLGLKEDCVLEDGLLYVHRKEDASHLYFVSNQQKKACKATLAFRVTGLQPELWNPVTGEIRTLQDYRIADNKTYIPLEFEPEGSWFVVFRRKADKASNGYNFPGYHPLASLEGTWKIDFKPVYGTPFQRTFKQLKDWSLSNDIQIKYYSGSATYKQSFNYDGQKHDSLYLDLGEVEGIAAVRLNGKEYPALWCKPYRIEISHALRPGMTELEVTVTNSWWNRLVGDSQPDTQPVTWAGNICWNANSSLTPAGMLGPVRILSQKSGASDTEPAGQLQQQDSILNIPMVYVEGGTFDMGATPEQGKEACQSEKPVHSVKVESFHIGTTEVTQAQWKAVMGNNPSSFKGDNLPVENITWENAMRFIRKLNKMTGLSYRLPTEEEWEYAARGGNRSQHNKYSGSNVLDHVGWFYENSELKTHPVGTKEPNELGIYDMSGNVWEWCQNYWRPEYTDDSIKEFRVFRGGGWSSNARLNRVSYRFNSAPATRSDLGFRLAR